MSNLPKTKLFNRNFTILLSGQSISVFGDQLFLLVLNMLIWLSTKSEFAMAMVMVCFGVPRFVLSFFTGTFSDRMSKKYIIVLADLLRGIIILVVAMLEYNNSSQVLVLYVTVFLLGIIEAFFHPAMQSSIPLIVPPQKLHSANALSQMLNAVLTTIAPAVGGIILAKIRAFYLILADGISFIIASVMTLFIKIPKVPVAHQKEKTGFIHDLKEGFQIVRSSKGLFLFLIVAAVLHVFMAPLFALMAPFLENYLHVTNPAELKTFYGLLIGSLGLGMTIGLIISSFVKLDGKVRAIVMFTCLLTYGACGIAIGGVQDLFFTMAFLVIIGIASAIFNISMITLIQRSTPPQHLGKVLGIITGTTGGLLPIGFALSGIIAEVVDIPVLLVISYSIVLLGVILLAFQKEFFKFCSMNVLPTANK